MRGNKKERGLSNRQYNFNLCTARPRSFLNFVSYQIMLFSKKHIPQAFKVLLPVESFEEYRS